MIGCWVVVKVVSKGRQLMRYGTIVKYFQEKKFGFIRSDTGRDVFFHISAFGETEAPPQLKTGQPVKYELTPRAEMPETSGSSDSRGRSQQQRAKLVTLIDKLPGGVAEPEESLESSRRHPRARQRKPTWRR